MNDQEKDKLFGEIGVKLGFFSSEDVTQALDQQKVDEAIGARKPIGAYLFEAKKISKEQIAQVVKEQSNYEISTPSNAPTAPLSEPVLPKTNTGIMSCFACGKDVGISVAICPHCGTRLKTNWLKVGCIAIVLLGLALSGLTCMGFLGAVSSVAQKQEEQKKALAEKLRNDPISPDITSESLYPMFRLGTEFTDIQRENKTKEIVGKKVRWLGSVFEVGKTSDGYKIQLKMTSNQIGAFIYLEGHDNAAVIEKLKEGDQIIAVGIVEDVLLRNVQLKPAFLELAGSSRLQPQSGSSLPPSSPSENPKPPEPEKQGQAEKKTTTENQVVQGSVQPKVFKEMETAHVGYMSYLVAKSWWSKKLSDNPFDTQQPDAMFLFLQVVVRNDDKQARSIAPFKLVDENGAECDVSSKAIFTKGHINIGGDLNPGVQKEGVVVFDVLLNHKYCLKVSGGFSSSENALIKIAPVNDPSQNSQPQQASPSQPLPNMGTPVTNAGPESPEMVNVKTVTDALYSAVFKADLSPKLESIKHFLTPTLYSLIAQEAQRPRSEDDDEPVYQFVPGNGGADGYTIQSPLVSGEIASVAVSFYFNGQPVNPNWKMQLQLEKQNNNQWLVSNVYYVSEDGSIGIDFISNLSEALKQASQQPTQTRLLVLWVRDKDGVVLRNAPARSGQKVLVMPFSSQVIVEDTNGPSETIGGITAKWFKVKTKDAMQEGWCFSGLLTDKEPQK